MGDGSACQACYIYAFCTRPDCRGRGYGRRLLAYMEERAAVAGCGAVVMVPGEQSLFDFYAGLGYETAFFHREEVLLRQTPGTAQPVPCDSTAYNARRETLLRGACHVSYDVPVLDYQRSLCRWSGGGLYQWEGGVAAVETDGDTLFCKELLSSRPQEDAASLLALLGREKAVVRTPGGEKPFGVAKWLIPALGIRWDCSGGYLAFAFD